MAAAANYKFIESKRGGQTLVVDNYMFRVHSRVGTKFWCDSHFVKLDQRYV
jgi:hypothetical protein